VKPSAGGRKSCQQLFAPKFLRAKILARKQLSESLSTLKGTAREGSELVGFSLLELLDNGFSRWRWGGIVTSVFLH